MLQVVLVLLLSVSFAWSQDQVKNSESNSGLSQNKVAASCPVGQDYLQRTLNNLYHFDETKLDPDQPNALLAKLIQLGPLPRPLIQHECIDNALATVTAGEPLKKGQRFRKNDFIRCSSDNRPIHSQEEPCTTTEYRTLVHNSFELTTACLKEFVTGSKELSTQNLWVESYFKMLSTESGMHVNVASKIGAIGIGQLRPEFVADFVQRTLPDLRAYLTRPEAKSACKRIGSELLTDAQLKKLYNTHSSKQKKSNSYSINTCANIDIEDGQPLMNLIISFANIKNFREGVVAGLFQNPDYKIAFGNLSPQQSVDLQIKLVSWSYNLGTAGLVNHIKKVLRGAYSNKAITNVDRFIQVASGVDDRKNYVAAIDRRYKDVLKGRNTCRTDLRK